MDIDFTLTGQRIREARQCRGWTADVLAEKVGLATESLRHIENASSKPSLQTLFRIATELDVSLDYILYHSFLLLAQAIVFAVAAGNGR